MLLGSFSPCRFNYCFKLASLDDNDIEFDIFMNIAVDTIHAGGITLVNKVLRSNEDYSISYHRITFTEWCSKYNKHTDNYPEHNQDQVTSIK